MDDLSKRDFTTLEWPTSAVDVRIEARRNTYFVVVDGRVKDSFSVPKGQRLTYSQLLDVEAGYREALMPP